VARYNTGLVAGEHEKVSTKITLSIDVVKIVGKYVIEVEVVKNNFTVRDWLTVLENNMIYRKSCNVTSIVNTLGSGVSTYTFLIGSAKGENEKSIRLIFDKASKESTMIIKRIDIRGVEDPEFPLKNV
jgi:hypothetical protein